MIETSLAQISSTTADQVAKLRTLIIDAYTAEWNAAVDGNQQNLEKLAATRTAFMNFLADPSAYEQFRDWDRNHAAASDPLLARQVKLIHYAYAQNQRDPQTIEAISKLMMQIDDIYTNFRAEVEGKQYSDNEVENVLDVENDNEVRREVWEASKEIGPVAAPPIRQLAHLRNQTARNMGFANYHRMALELDEVDPDWLYAMLYDLAKATDAPFREVKAELDQQLSKRFRVPVEELRPWHYADRYFQRGPKLGDIDMDKMYTDQKLEDLALKTYDGLGMDVRDILARSDLYERKGKNQHAFCIHIDREGDVRTLNNLQQNRRWMDTLLHELGHGVFDKYIPKDIPWMLREPSHILTTEAMAILMGGMVFDRDWLTLIRGLPAAEVDSMLPAVNAQNRLDRLIFARVMVMVNFERGMYENPDGDLDTLWWDLVERYQLLKRPDGRNAPDWATKYHVALAPAYYQNYLLGEMVAIQWYRWLTQNAGGLINRTEAGDFFRKRVYGVGRTMTWTEGLQHATGEPLNIQYYVDRWVKN